MTIRFSEQQKFIQGWIGFILIGVFLFSFYGIYQQIIVGAPFGQQPMSNTGLTLFSLLMLGVTALFSILQLNTEIDDHEIRIVFVPLIKRRIPWDEIKRIEVVDYGFVGGWGIRPWTRYGTVYNTRGRHGVAIELNNGKKCLIGTQKVSELTAAIAGRAQTAS